MREARPALVIAAAQGWLGTPYHDQASVAGAGCDCLGLLRGVWRDVVGPEAHPVPPYSRHWGDVVGREVLIEALGAVMLRRRALRAGRVIVFRMRPGRVAKHSGILTAPGRFVHALERQGVVETELGDNWRRRIVRVFAYPGSD